MFFRNYTEIRLSKCNAWKHIQKYLFRTFLHMQIAYYKCGFDVTLLYPTVTPLHLSIPIGSAMKREIDVTKVSASR